VWSVREGGTKIETTGRFSTAFVRAPFRFRFAIEETADSIVVHATEAEVRVVSANRPLQRFRTLRDAIKPMFGCAAGVLSVAVPLLLGWPETIFGRERTLELTRDDTDFTIGLDARGAIASVHESWSGHAIAGGPTAIDRRTILRAELDAAIGEEELRFEAAVRARRVLN